MRNSTLLRFSGNTIRRCEHNSCGTNAAYITEVRGTLIYCCEKHALALEDSPKEIGLTRPRAFRSDYWEMKARRESSVIVTLQVTVRQCPTREEAIARFKKEFGLTPTTISVV